MNLIKRRKLTAIITLSVMLVAAVATACILTVPNLYKGGEDVVPTNTATAYGMGQAKYTSDTTSMVYVDITGKNSGDSGDLRVLFPKTIYLDKTESLTDAGYYILYNAYSNIGSTDESVVVYDTCLGYYGNGATIPTDTNANTMNTVFKDYGIDSRSIVVGGTILTGRDGNIKFEDSNGSLWDYNSGVEIGTKGGSNTVMKNTLTGTIINTAANYRANDAVVGDSNVNNAKFVYPTGKVMSYLRWYGSSWGVTKWRDIGYNSKPTSFASSASGYFYRTESEMKAAGFGDLLDTKYVNNIEINIHIYDKEALNSAISNFESKVLTEANKSILNKITGSDVAYNAAKAYCGNARTCLTTREVDQKTINEYTNGLNNYTFELSDFEELAPQDFYNGSVVDLSNYWTRYDSRFFKLEIDGATSGVEIKDADNNQPKTYNLRLSPVQSYTLNIG
ncbi:MAG: hypothetical protein K2L61_03460, partial [Clostridia bacterium]|nr:hypothetical protein [Clostridia bacterium]